MTTTLHATNVFNVRTTLNTWLQNALADIVRPYWLPDYTLVQITPESEIPTPSFSITHIDVGTFDRFQGRTAQDAVAIMEVNAWASRSNVNWQAQLTIMQAMVHQASLSQPNGGIVIYDYSDPLNPTATAYRAHLGDVTAVSTGPDPNPDIERVRILVDYRWIARG